MTKLYFIRHGKTEWNQAGRFQGANGDSPLLATSYDQIEQLGQHLKAIKFTHAFSSPITRAKITAEETIKYLDFKPALTLQPGLGEFGMGIWEGMEFHAVMAQWPAMYDAYRHHPDQFDASQIEGAETFANVQLRFRQAVEAAVSQYGGTDVNLVFFSHGMALTAGMAGLLEIPLAQSRARGGLGNTSTSILETPDGIHYTELIRNDISYLTSANDASNTI